MDGPGLSGSASIAAAIGFHVPQFDTVAWWQLTILIVALIFCGLASAAETALTTISHFKLKDLVAEDEQNALKIDRLLADPNTYLTTILIVNTISVIVVSCMATMLALRVSTNWGDLLAIILSSLIVLIFCEILPKTAALQNPLRLARFIVRPMRTVAWLLRPLVWFLNAFTALLVRLFGGHVRHQGPFVTEEELRMLVNYGEEEGVLEQEETEMINSIFEFADTTVREVMVPRIDMVTLANDATVNQAVDVALEGGFSRIPVYEESEGVDEIIGILYTKDLLRQLREGHQAIPVRDLVRPAYFVPETKKLDELLREIRQNRIHMVVVVDEYGSVAGLVTIEDLVEEIVGDIQDEYDHEEKLYEQINENEYVFDAKISIYDFNELMDMHLDDSDYETLGGFVYAQLGKIPNAGDTIEFEKLKITVLATRGRRITKIRVERTPVQSERESETKSNVLMLPSPERDSGSGFDRTEANEPSEEASSWR
jgi:CBS domain containing-hemolysin-like protein